MKKSTKIIATVIAVTLVITAMLVAIYAATAGNANISANVSWTAQAGVNLEFWAKTTGGDESKEIAKTTITPTTTNTDANIIGDLSCNFTDTTDDGVNNPNAIKFTYYVRNKSLTPLNIKVTKTPAEAEESGTGAENHKPKVTLNSDTEGNNTLTAVSSTSGYDLKAGDIFTYSVTLSLAKGGTGTINADFGLAPNFDAGVTFNFNVGGDSNGTIVTSVDGASPTTVSSSTLSGQTLGEYLATQQTAEYSTGWFFDEGLSKVVSDDYLSQSLNDSSLMSSLYCKTASIDRLRFVLNSDESGYLVGCSSYSDAAGEFIIPNIYNGKKVVGTTKGSMHYGRFSGAFGKSENVGTGNEELPSKVILPNTFQTIENYAFMCSLITSIAIPDSVTSIGDLVFIGCVFDSIIVGEGNTIYDSRDNCNALIETASNTLIKGSNSTIIPNSVTSIGSYAFQNCTSLTSIEIPNSVTSIGVFAFEGCSGLTSIVIPNRVTSIENSMFYECSSLTNVSIGNSVTSIMYSAFYKCVNLKNITIPNSVTNIGGSVFEGCSGLASIEIPNSVTSIESSTFSGCTGLTNVTIGNSVTSIGSSAFQNCSGLTKIFIPKSVTTISASSYDISPFSSCSSTLQIYCEASSKPSGWGTYWNYYASGKTLNVTWGVTRAQFEAL